MNCWVVWHTVVRGAHHVARHWRHVGHATHHVALHVVPTVTQVATIVCVATPAWLASGPPAGDVPALPAPPPLNVWQPLNAPIGGGGFGAGFNGGGGIGFVSFAGGGGSFPGIESKEKQKFCRDHPTDRRCIKHVPEPSSLLLLIPGALALIMRRKR